MENNTNNDERYFNWISSIIDSCTDTFHFEALDNLIELYKQKTGNDILYLELGIKKQIKFNEVHLILK
jgi:hypothetical protein